MNIAFWDNSLCERGTTVSLYDYANYNEVFLKNKSFIFYDKNHRANTSGIIEKFKKRFVVHETDNFKEVDDYLTLYNITHIYIIKGGEKDSRLSTLAKNCIHCVFHCNQPHGDVYSSISPWVSGNQGNYPVVPHMIDLPEHSHDMRSELNIPKEAIVFGGYGGKESFSIGFVHQVVYRVAKQNPNIYFLFANFDRFCPDLPNIIHYPMIIEPTHKVKFINTTDAMLWARNGGETFGIAIGEFSSKNKPVIATKFCGGDISHVHLLGEKAIWYTPETLHSILVNFNPSIEKDKDWNAYKEYKPENVMSIFKNIYLDQIDIS